jgi:hypothetical protein
MRPREAPTITRRPTASAWSAARGSRRPLTRHVFAMRMSRRRASARIPLLFMMAALLAEASACAPHEYPAAAVKANVIVLAGDHLIVDGQDIVLADAETPQPQPRAHCRAEIIAAAGSKATAEALARDARYVETEPETPRPFGLVHLDGLDLGLTLTSQGLAVPRRPVAMHWCS